MAPASLGSSGESDEAAAAPVAVAAAASDSVDLGFVSGEEKLEKSALAAADGGSSFWDLFPHGVPVEALFGSQGGSGEVGRRLRTYDKNGNGFLDKDEFRGAVRQELSSQAQVRLMRKVAAAVLAICVLLLLAIFGLSVAVTELTKQVEVTKQDPVMRVAGTNEAVQTSSTDLKVVNGALAPRDEAAAKASLSSEDGAVVEDAQTASATGNKLTVVAEERTYTARLKSCMSNAHFASMKSFEVKSGLMSLRVDVLGYARVARKASLYGTVVILITPIGRITIDGEAMSFSNDVGDVFAEAGFNTAAEGSRRLLNFYELIALFNQIPAEKYGCFEESVDGPKPSFPMLATARVRKMESCTNLHGESKEVKCDTSDPTIVEENGFHYAGASGWVYMDVENQLIREELNFDSRTKDYKLVVIQNTPGLIKNFFMIPTTETAKRQSDKPSFSADAASAAKETQTKTYADNNGLLYQTGYWCLDQQLNSTVQAGKYNLDNVQAAYEGTTLLDGGVKERRFTIRVRTANDNIAESKSDRTVFIYHDRSATANTQGFEFLPYRVELYDLDTGMLMGRTQFEEWNLNVTSEDMLSDGIFAKPAKCHSGGDNTVSAKHILRSTSLLPGADDGYRTRIQEMNLKHLEDNKILAEKYMSAATGNASTATNGGGQRRQLRRLLDSASYTKNVPIGSPYLCCGNRYVEDKKTEYDTMTFTMPVPPQKMGKIKRGDIFQLDLGFSTLFPRFEGDVASMDAGTEFPPQKSLCYIQVSFSSKGFPSIVPPLKIAVGGSLFVDWTPDGDEKLSDPDDPSSDPLAYDGCVQGGGCIEITLGVDFLGLCSAGFTVGFCGSGGNGGNIDGCRNRKFFKGSFSLEVFVECVNGGVSGTLGGALDAFIYLPGGDECSSSKMYDKGYHLFVEGGAYVEVCLLWSCFRLYETPVWRPLGDMPGTIIHYVEEEPTEQTIPDAPELPPPAPPPPPPLPKCDESTCKNDDFCDICASKCAAGACVACKDKTGCDCEDVYETNCGSDLVEMPQCKASQCDSEAVCRHCRDARDDLACIKCSSVLNEMCSCNFFQTTYMKAGARVGNLMDISKDWTKIMNTCLEATSVKYKDCFQCYASCDSAECSKCEAERGTEDRALCEGFCATSDISLTNQASGSSSSQTSSTYSNPLWDSWNPGTDNYLNAMEDELRKARCDSGEKKYCCFDQNKYGNDKAYCGKEMFKQARGYSVNDTYDPLFDRSYSLADCYFEWEEPIGTKYNRNYHKEDPMFYDFARLDQRGLPGLQVEALGQPKHFGTYLTKEADHGLTIDIMESIFDAIDQKKDGLIAPKYQDYQYSLEMRKGNWSLSDYADFFKERVAYDKTTCYRVTGDMIESWYNEWYYGGGAFYWPLSAHKDGPEADSDHYRSRAYRGKRRRALQGKPDTGEIYCKRSAYPGMYTFFGDRADYDKENHSLNFGLMHRLEVEGFGKNLEYGGNKLAKAVAKAIRHCAYGPARPDVTTTYDAGNRQKTVTYKGDIIGGMTARPQPKMNGYLMWKEDQNPSSCFPGNANVCVREAEDGAKKENAANAAQASSSWCPSTSGRLVPMSHLRVGDVVMSGNGRWSRVYAFGHHHPTAEDSTTLTITFGDHGGRSSTLSGRHHTFRCASMNGMKCTSTEEVMASQLEVGDYVFAYGSDGQEMLSPVTKVVSKTSIGMYTPVTYDDTVIVDGVKHSVYTSHVRVLQPVGYFPARLFDLLMPETNARMANRALFDEGEVFGSLGYLRWLARDLIGFDV